MMRIHNLFENIPSIDLNGNWRKKKILHSSMIRMWLSKPETLQRRTKRMVYLSSFEKQTMINNLTIIRTSHRLSLHRYLSVWSCFSSRLVISHFFLLSFCLCVSSLLPSVSFRLSLLQRHILSAWLLSSDFFSSGGVCQRSVGWGGGWRCTGYLCEWE